jgi:hypothetical protein
MAANGVNHDKSPSISDDIWDYHLPSPAPRKKQKQKQKQKKQNKQINGYVLYIIYYRYIYE